MLKNEQKFYTALEDVFIGEAGKKIEGKSGFVNLMKIKSQYFAKIKPYIQKEVAEKLKDDKEREELYQKLYTFFESYLNETGTPFFSQTPFYKNLYEKVYSEREDVSLFWKTQRLYYVKSEATYATVNNLEVDELLFDFDASNIEHKKSNEKKELEFYLTDASNEKLTFKVLYADNSRAKYDKIKEYLGQDSPDAVRKFIAENDGKVKHPHIKVVKNNLKREGLKTKTLQDALLLISNEDAINTVTIEFAISKIDDMLAYAEVNNLYKVTEDGLKKAFAIYKKQNEVDYFIHKDAEAFLKEQFDLFMYQQFFGDNNLYNEWKVERIEYIQKIKQLAYRVIEYIARFEDELKAIWNKPKFVRNSNYVLTLDKLENNVELIKKIISHPGWEKQVEEWKELWKEWQDKNGNVIKKEWKEFEKAANVKAKDVIKNNKLNEDFEYLPIETKHFGELKFEILENIDSHDKDIDGVLIKSDNYQALNTILPKYKGKIDLIYIDPPFNTGDDFDYKDNYRDSTWFSLMTNRLEIAKELLNNKGSFYLHLDENANHFGRMVADKIFGKNNFRREIIWDIQVLSGFKVLGAESNWILGHQSIYFYTKNSDYKFNKLMQEHSQKYLDMFDRTDADGEKYLIAHKRKRLLKDVIDKGKAFGDVWNDLKETFNIEKPFQEVWEQILERVNNGRPFADVWGDIMSFQQQPTAAERILFDTQKPEKLLDRIIQSSTDPRDIVLDYFAGSGTTASCAQQINRFYINIEQGEYFNTIILPRMKRILIGQKTNVAKDNDYKGGGFFKYYELEQYEEALVRAKYNPREGDLSNINFSKDEKLLDAMVIDEGKEEVKIHFELLYPDVDIAETISNVTGKKIKKLNKERVIFEDDTKIEFANMNYYDPIFKDAYRSLLWWKSKE
ncbi:MAG TPA: DNA methyltransferase [Ignavibacteriaceae bacterium]|nr:DNA methyltransferase [Ignavibacteriaceae bacterium]